MLIYFIAAFLSFTFMLISRKSKNKILSYFLLIISLSTLWVVAAFRFNVGSDFNSYYYYLQKLKIGSIDFNFTEYGLIILAKIISVFTTEGQYLIGVTSLIIIFLIFLTIKKYSRYPEISILLLCGLGFYFTSLNIVRQYIALAIVFYAVKFLLEKQNKKFVIYVIFASLFHITALNSLLFLLIYNLKKSNLKNRLIISVSFITLLIFYEFFLDLVLIGSYSEYSSTRFITEGANLIFFIIYISIFLVLNLFKEELKASDANNEFFLLMIFVGALISLLSTNSLILMRIAEYYTIFNIIVLANFIEIIRSKYLRVIVYGAIVSVSFLGMWIFLSQNLGNVLPYTFLNK